MITIVVGGQYGGEGKGKVSAVLSNHRKFDIVCRTGGVNSCHSIVKNGEIFKLRMMPTASVVDKSPDIVFGAGTLIHIETLFSEVERVGYDLKKIRIDPNAGIVSEDCIAAQRADERYQLIGSTLTGTGYATAYRAQRKLKLARDYQELKGLLVDTSRLLFEAARDQQEILLEGHQGSGLSNYHGDYPYVSSRDCISASLLSEVGLGLNWKFDVWLAVKTFPTRNHPGSLYGEMAAQEADVLGIHEYGGGSWSKGNVRRRVGVLDFELLRRAIRLNSPNHIALTCMDYWDKGTSDVRSFDELSLEAKKLINEVKSQTGTNVDLVSTGPELESCAFRNPQSAKPSRHKPKRRGSIADQTELNLDDAVS